MGQKHQRAFIEAKKLPYANTMLIHYDINEPLKLFCDASPYSVGTCLVHVMSNGDGHPITYASRALTSTESNCAQIEWEALAIVFGICRFHQYLYGRSFTLVTDHHLLCKILGEKEGIPSLAAARMQCWALLLSAYSYSIQHIPGKLNYCADCLSHLPSPTGSRDTVVWQNRSMQ